MTSRKLVLVGVVAGVLATVLFTGGFWNAAQAQKGQAVGPKPPQWEFAELNSFDYTWTTGSEVVHGEDWVKLAGKLKIPNVKVGTAQMQILNFIGSERWELVTRSVWSQGFTAYSTYTFRRPPQ